jgi:hypothetical protein
LAELASVNRGQFMKFTDKSEIGLDEIDHVSTWLLRLAIGMMVLGAVFVVLDRCNYLPQLPAAAVAHAPVANSETRSPG